VVPFGCEVSALRLPERKITDYEDNCEIAVETSPLHSLTRFWCKSPVSTAISSRAEAILSWCNRLWVLKNSLARKPQKNDRVRMLYKRFSLLA
jgi:hypothetical protein